MSKTIALLAAASLAAICPLERAGAAIIAGFTGATTSDSTTLGANLKVFGQSFTIAGAGMFDDLSFSFLGTHPAGGTGTPAALGTLAIYSVAKTGTPAGGLAADDVALVARSTGIVDDSYRFAPGVTLAGGVQYFAYAYGFDPSAFHGGFVGGNPYVGGNFYDGLSGNVASFAASDAGFVLNGDAVVSEVPEPATWATMLCGLGLAGIALRHRAGAAIPC